MERYTIQQPWNGLLIILSDVAHFHLDGFVNRQNCKVWDSENSRVISKKEMYPQRVTI